MIASSPPLVAAESAVREVEEVSMPLLEPVLTGSTAASEQLTEVPKLRDYIYLKNHKTRKLRAIIWTHDRTEKLAMSCEEVVRVYDDDGIPRVYRDNGWCRLSKAGLSDDSFDFDVSYKFASRSPDGEQWMSFVRDV